MRANTTWNAVTSREINVQRMAVCFIGATDFEQLAIVDAEQDLASLQLLLEVLKVRVDWVESIKVTLVTFVKVQGDCVDDF